jgi:Ca-activated chloride channel family protein
MESEDNKMTKEVSEMRGTSRLWTLLMVVPLLLGASGVRAQSEGNGDKTLSPYFFVESDTPALDQLPLKSTSVRVNISGVIADVVVTQVYKNEGKRPIEAIYVFPASTRAAVYGMKMTIGERTIVAKILEREAARQEYERAKQTGKSASLLEQQRPNVFQMNVANILPSDVITVELKYTELLVPTDGIYTFVYPTVVGPRYSNQAVPDVPLSEQWIENPYLHEGEPPTYTFDMAVSVAAGLPIQDVTCASHKVNITYDGPAVAAIRLDDSEKHGGNRDFIVKYRLSGGKIETGLLLFEGEDENFFLLMVQPPKRVNTLQIPPREYIFIIDVSGSMHGFPLNISKKLLRDLIGGLRPNDRFNVLLFAGGSSVMSDHSLPATPENVRQAIDLIDRQRGGGGTEILPALRRALALPKAEGYSRTVVIATDGYVAVEVEAFDLIRQSLGHANMFPFGIGSSVNRYIVEGMARVGMGEPFVITRPEEAQQKAEKFRRLIESPVLAGIELDFGDFEVYDIEPPSVPDVLADRPVVVFGKWQGQPQGTIRLRGTTGTRPFQQQIDVGTVKPLKTNSALRYLWARHRIALLADYNRLNPKDERVKEVTNLGLSYNLLTAYTSFVAIDSQVRLLDGKPVTVKQPLPLPQGVSDYAVGNGFAAQKMSAAVAPLPTTAGPRVRVEEATQEFEADRLVSEPPRRTSALERKPIELGRITVTKGLSAPSVRRFLEKHMAQINTCYTPESKKQHGAEQKIVLTLGIDSAGRVTKAEVKKGRKIYEGLARCLVETLSQVSFPAPRGVGNGVITLVFAVR